MSHRDGRSRAAVAWSSSALEDGAYDGGGDDPLAWFTDVLARIADIPQSQLHELLPWHWKAAQQAQIAELAA